MRIAVSRTDEEREVSPLELFFDLVYVFAIGQLSHHLLEHVDLRTGAETLILALAVFIAWQNTAWGANWLDPDRLPVRLLLVGLMFASLLMSVAIGDAFDDRAWLFVTGYLRFSSGARCSSSRPCAAGRSASISSTTSSGSCWRAPSGSPARSSMGTRASWPGRSP